MTGAKTQPHAVERAVGLVLRIGVLLSGAIISLGLALLVLNGGLAKGLRIDAAIPYPRDLGAIFSGVLVLDPASVIQLGLLTLVATPFARVAASIVAFAHERDWRYTAITALVLAILVVGLLVGSAVE